MKATAQRLASALQAMADKAYDNETVRTLYGPEKKEACENGNSQQAKSKNITPIIPHPTEKSK